MKESILIHMKRNRANAIAKDLRSPKYRMRVVSPKNQYNRKDEKRKILEEMSYV